MVETEFNFWVPGPMLCYGQTARGSVGSNDASPLLASDLSPTSRLRRIQDGRKELMDMIRDLPESCYELSLKDIVVDLCPCTEGSGAEVDDKLWEKKGMRKRTRIIKEPGRATRTSGMEAGSFLIRMFLPGFLMTGKKQRRASSGNRTTKTPASSLRVSLDRTDGRWPLAREEEWRRRSNSCTSRIEHGSSGGFLSGCWLFGGSNDSRFKVVNSKMARQKTCIF